MSPHIMDRGGGGPAFLLLHGFGGSSELWTDVIAGLPSGPRCVAPDLRGFGRSPGAVACIDDHLDDLEAIVRERGLSDFVVAGHSMGGKLAAALAARRPVGLRAVALIAASPLGPEPMDDLARTTLLAQHGDRVAAEALVDQITAGPLHPNRRASFVASNLATSADAWRWWLESGSQEDLSRRAADVSAPVFILAGSHDPVLGLPVQNEAVLTLRARQLSLAPEAGHLTPLEDPRACIRLLMAAAAAGAQRPMFRSGAASDVSVFGARQNTAAAG